jgi:hypothetical protein
MLVREVAGHVPALDEMPTALLDKQQRPLDYSSFHSLVAVMIWFVRTFNIDPKVISLSF